MLKRKLYFQVFSVYVDFEIIVFCIIFASKKGLLVNVIWAQELISTFLLSIFYGSQDVSIKM